MTIYLTSDLSYRKSQADKSIMTAAKLISPAIENTFATGFDWFV